MDRSSSSLIVHDTILRTRTATAQEEEDPGCHHDGWQQAMPHLLRRSWAENAPVLAACTDDSTVIRVMQFNVLADGLTGAGGGYQAFDLPEEERRSILGWPDRCWRLLAVILQHAPDLVALEEVDHYADFFEPELSRHGYAGCINLKYNAPSYRLGNLSDGCALFWRRDCFSLEANRSGRLRYRCPRADDDNIDEASPLTLVQLRDRQSNRRWDVAVVHLKSKVGADEEAQRRAQIGFVEETLTDLLVEADGDNVLQLLLGDFNADPFPVVDAHDGSSILLPECVDAVRSAGWHSALPLPVDEQDLEHCWTTNKKRVGQPVPVQHSIDYVLYRPAEAAMVARWLRPAGGLLPSGRYPSDHLAQVVDLCVPRRSPPRDEKYPP